jgi:predicted Zn-dependent peptidase
MKSQLHLHSLSNGLTLVGESMPWLQSCAFTLLTQGGTARESADRLGSSGVALEMVQRGAGPLDSRAIVEKLDFLGVERNSSVSTYHAIFSAAMLAEALQPTLKVYADIVQSPHLDADELEDAKQVALQELHGMEDEPTHRCFTELKRIRFSEPFGRSAFGTESGIMATALSDVRDFHDRYFTPSKSILAIAGNFDWKTLVQWVEKLFGKWKPKPLSDLPAIETHSQSRHLQQDSSQTHISLAYDCVPYQHAEYYRSRGLVGILSDGMSSRLFTEVREKRGLVYSVTANCQTIGNRGSVMCYAGTTAERAQETLDITVQTIRSLADGIHQDELRRLKTRVKTALVTEQESSISRSSQIATDYYFLGRVPTHAEVFAEIEALTEASLLDHYQRYPAHNWTLVTLGNQPLELPRGI